MLPICFTSTDHIVSFDEGDGDNVDEDHILDVDVCALPSALLSQLSKKSSKFNFFWHVVFPQQRPDRRCKKKKEMGVSF